jgi:RimJ/RimL family protein N-acetyltransferase
LLRRPTLADAGAIFYRYASDPVVTRYLSWPTHRSRTEIRRTQLHTMSLIAGCYPISYSLDRIAGHNPKMKTKRIVSSSG